MGVGISVLNSLIQIARLHWINETRIVISESSWFFRIPCGFLLLLAFRAGGFYHNKVYLTVPAVVANCLVFLIGYMVFRGANKQKHNFKKNPKTPIWRKILVVVGGKLQASGYWL